MVKILDYDNTSRIFFVNKVILVEGEGDELFFRYYLDKYLDGNGNEEETEIEIVNIGGKSAQDKWRCFLEKWGIKVYYVGDWDNVVEFNILNEDELEGYKREHINDVNKKIFGSIRDKNSIDGRTLTQNLYEYLDTKDEKKLDNLRELTKYLYERHTPAKKILSCIPQKKKEQIARSIESKYKENIFILKEGELEDYLQTKKDVSAVIEFCKQGKEPLYKDELNKIFEKIVAS